MNYEELINVMKENLTDNDLPDEIQTMMAVFQLQLKSAIRTMPIKETYDRVISWNNKIPLSTVFINLQEKNGSTMKY